jgi:D-aspartate ligase
MKSEHGKNHKVPVIVSGNDNVNNLGVVRALGRHGIKTILISSNRQDIVRYSRYTTERLNYPDPRESEDKYIESLLNYGRQKKDKAVIIPTTDAAIMALSRHKDKLEPYFLLPFPNFEVVEKLVNKRLFYQLLGQLSIPYPRTYFPADLDELKTIGEEIEYPYIIKPAYMHVFRMAFNAKCFFIDSSQKLDDAIGKLEAENQDVFLQEIIPGKELHSLSTYLNNKSKFLSVCGYDKLRQDPPDFGVGTLWRSAYREEPANLALQILEAVNYYGFAEIEFIKDPRDNQYKCLEVNARTVVPNSLGARCGTDITYIGYLDTIGQHNGNTNLPQSGILWVDEINDLRVCIKKVFKRETGILEIIKSLRGRKVYATASRDDLMPLFVALFHQFCHYLKRLFSFYKLFFHEQRGATTKKAKKKYEKTM